ncbi:hypothetical protein GCK72_013103 [Caenorhabditis remanei]|uniref:DUF38 domain-containing protein n=1 Tax=Caenorhabditis remanei TaxID=31234 RepID=A0A6A5GQA3_CAERE|nr:hypothetical protein GCK72_013103 [Caenorhabditis remanei]KAF1756649.1 hypothetical protein GCK72_013103 [Caenorhabditis remanei]
MPISVDIMYSDVIATIDDGINEKVTLTDDTDVSNKVKEYLDEKYVKRSDVELEHISILLLSYTNPPQLPFSLPCKSWNIRCESHTPYVINLLNSIPLNCDLLKIEVDNLGFGEIADMEQVRTAKMLSLKMTDQLMEFGISGEQFEKFKAEKVYLNGHDYYHP